MTKSIFFLQQVPQSEYRRTRKRRDEDTQYLSTELNPLGIIDANTKDHLKTYIAEQVELVFNALLPGDNCADSRREPLLESIYSQLGIA